MKFPFEYTGNLKWLEENTNYLVRAGSHSHGINTAESDEDFRGFVIAPKEYYLGLINNFAQAEGNKPDYVIYELRKYFDLALNCNPNIIENLFVDESDILICDDVAEKFLEKRDLLLSSRVRYTFCGYAYSQMKRIKSHRKFILNPITKKPERKDFGLQEKPEIKKEQLLAIQSQIDKKLHGWIPGFGNYGQDAEVEIKEKISELLTDLKITSDDMWAAAARQLGCTENFIHILQKEKEFNNAETEYNQYLHWKAHRNPARYKLEEKYHYDLKHGSTLIRICCMGQEILRTGKVIVKRPDREKYLSIRRGEWSFEQLEETFNKLMIEIEEDYKNTKLPHTPNRKEIDKLCIEVIEKSFHKNK